MASEIYGIILGPWKLMHKVLDIKHIDLKVGRYVSIASDTNYISQHLTPRDQTMTDPIYPFPQSSLPILVPFPTLTSSSLISPSKFLSDPFSHNLLHCSSISVRFKSYIAASGSPSIDSIS